MGLIAGKLLCLIVTALYNNFVTIVATVLATNYVVYYTAEEILYVSGEVSVVFVGIMLSGERNSMPPEIEKFLVRFWDALALFANVVVYTIVAIIAVDVFATSQTHFKHAVVIVVTYTVVTIGRYLAFWVLQPIVGRTGYGLSFRGLIVCVWGGITGSFSLCLALIIYHEEILSVMRRDAIIFVTGLVYLKKIVNVISMPSMLNTLGLSQMSMARKVNMNNCVRHVLNRREHTVSMLKLERYA